VLLAQGGGFIGPAQIHFCSCRPAWKS